MYSALKMPANFIYIQLLTDAQLECAIKVISKKPHQIIDFLMPTVLSYPLQVRDIQQITQFCLKLLCKQKRKLALVSHRSLDFRINKRHSLQIKK